MQNRYSGWQLSLPESKKIYGVEDCIYELAMQDSSPDPAAKAAIYAAREDAPSCAYDIAETILRRRKIVEESGHGYHYLKRCLEISSTLNISFEQSRHCIELSDTLHLSPHQAKCFFIKGALTWFLEAAPVLLQREAVQPDIILNIYSYVIGSHLTVNDVETVTAAMIRKIGFFKLLPSPSNNVLLSQYQDRVSNFTEPADADEDIKIKL